MSEHSAHLTSLPFGFRTWLWRYTCLLLLISMLWHRQAIFESKGDKLSSSAESRIRTRKSQDTYSPADWMPSHKPTELSRIKLKNLNSTAHPYDEWAFSPLVFTAVWLSHLALAINMFVVVDFDALAQASDIRISFRLNLSGSGKLCHLRNWIYHPLILKTSSIWMQLCRWRIEQK